MRRPLARITDAEALRAITPAALRAYVVAEGWQRVGTFGSHSDVYVRDDHPELILPGTNSLGDYASVIGSVISLVAGAESRDELQVFRDLSVADRDVIRVRAPAADDDGSIRIEEGVELVVHARDLLLSSACSAWDPRPAYRAGKVRKAEQYIERVRLGQTEQGSFVITLLAPVPPALDQPDQPTLWPMEEEEPYERLVTRKFTEGLAAARVAVEATNRGASFDVFERSVPRGVSANLCDAVSRLIRVGDGLDISVTWARTRRTPEARREISFSPADADVLKEAARLFHEKQPRPDERLEGFIVRLGRDETEFDGRVTIRAFVDDRMASVHVDFPHQMYEQALDAHRNKRLVTVVGTLERQGQRWWLRAPSELRVGLEDEEA